VRVVVVHNRYRSAQPSGENRVVESDIAALEADGVEVFPYIRDSDEIDAFTVIGKAGVAVRPIASPVDSIAFRRLLREVQPNIVHLHNPYPLISPWIVRTAKAMRVPVVQTVHNYRHVCANGLYFRDSHECTDCVGKAFPWPAIKHGCYRNSTLQSIPMATSLWAHRSTWMMVDRFLPVGEHVADHLRAFGIPDHKIIVRPNVVLDPGEPTPLGNGALFVGRLSEEKGVRLLLDAWKLAGVGAEHTLTIAGDGELRPLVEAAAAADTSIKYVGLVPRDEVGALYEHAELVVVPSIWPEPDPLVAVGALAAGRSVLACRLGAMARYIDDQCGWLADPAATSVATTLSVALSNRDELVRRGSGARDRYASSRSSTTRPGLSSIYRTLATVPRGSVAVVGPDGAGKSTLVESIVAIAETAHVDVTRAHFRPGVLLRTRGDGAPVEDPHSQDERSAMLALPRTILVWLDFAAGWIAPWRRASRRGLLLLERPWLDQAVDPRRYRLSASATRVVEVLGRLLPRADVCVELKGDPEAINQRKPEIGVTEVARQQRKWLELAPMVARRVIEVDSVSQSMKKSTALVLESLQPNDMTRSQSWSAPWGYPTRIGLRVTSDIRPRDALSIYPPQKRTAIIRNRVAATGVAIGLGAAVDEPPVPIHEILSQLKMSHNGIAAMRSSRGGRWILGIEQAGELAVVAKCGPLSDVGLRNEAQALSLLSGGSRPFHIPELIYSGEIDDAFVVIVKSASHHKRSSHLDVDKAASIATTLTLGIDPLGPIVHGDFAEWNLIWSGDGVTVIDWEAWHVGRAPLWDLSHYVVQHAALVRNVTVTDVIETLTSRGSVGVRHLCEIGEPAESARGHLRSYLEQALRNDAGASFRAELLKAVA
jgi:glycosyltransferase involved in cell wall biosynthesis